MSQKSIFFQVQNIHQGHISKHKPCGFCAINVDNVKITVDAYNGSGPDSPPRPDALIEVIDQHDVFELTPEKLVKALRYYYENAPEDDIIRYKNKNHYIMPDALKPIKKRSII